MIDSGAKICTLNQDQVANEKIKTKEKIIVKGLNGTVETLGTVVKKLKIKNQIVKQKFHILPKQAKTLAHGILAFWVLTF